MAGVSSTIGADLDAVVEASAVLDARSVRSVFQPIVRLDNRAVVGYEALSRGPAGTRFESPVELFCAAAALGRTAELDWVCRARAVEAALRADLRPPATLFVNAEPAALYAPCPPDLRPVLASAHGRLRVVMEITERAIADDPAKLLAAAAAARRAGWGVALDDVGVDPGSLALMPFVRPDVVKLDAFLLRHPDRVDTSRTVAAVTAYAERTGATVLAEGIETERQLVLARTMGATLGQGWLFGHPGRPPRPPAVPDQALPLLDDDGAAGMWATPYEIVTARRPGTLATKAMLRQISRHLEDRAADEPEPPVVIGCFQHARHFAAAARQRFAALAREAALVAVVGADLPERPLPHIHGARLGPGDPLLDEWNVIVVGPHFAGALVARDLGDTGPEGERRFAYAVTYDRDLVLAAARSLLVRLAPIGVAGRGGPALPFQA